MSLRVRKEIMRADFTRKIYFYKNDYTEENLAATQESFLWDVFAAEHL